MGWIFTSGSSYPVTATRLFVAGVTPIPPLRCPVRTRLVRRLVLVALLLGLTAVGAQPPAPAAKPSFLFGYNLMVRPGGQIDWDKAAKIGVELNKDTGTNALLALTESGNLSVAAGEPGTVKKADWVFALDLKVRKADEDKFTKETFTVGVEMYKDGVTGKLLYLSEKKGVTLATAPAAAIGDGKNPVWQYGLILKARKPEEAGFTKDTKRFGVEVFKDENTGGLIYATEDGGLAAGGAAPAKAPEEGKVAAPKSLYGLVVRVRKADEANFTEKTKKIGIEVYKDENSGQLVFLSESGSLAVVPPPAKMNEKPGITWKHALTIKARPAGIDFAKAPKYGIEVVEDNNTGYTLYVTETGSIAVLPK